MRLAINYLSPRRTRSTKYCYSEPSLNKAFVSFVCFVVLFWLPLSFSLQVFRSIKAILLISQPLLLAYINCNRYHTWCISEGLFYGVSSFCPKLLFQGILICRACIRCIMLRQSHIQTGFYKHLPNIFCRIYAFHIHDGSSELYLTQDWGPCCPGRREKQSP